MKIVLASGSPRRQELLARIGIEPFEVMVSDREEVAPPGLTHGEIVCHLSGEKAAAVQVKAGPDALVIAADTIVALDGRILGKPSDREVAKRMLTLLSGRRHEVYTGITLAKGSLVRSEYEMTAVSVRPLHREEIDAYVETGEPMDKAGAYGIQGLGALFVSRIEGDYYNVMGLPLCRLGQMLPEFGVKPLLD
jgi:septum formation protein